MDRPQRRVFSANFKLETRDPRPETYTNRYLAMAAAKANEEADFDPIYIYDLNGNRISMFDPTGFTTYNYDALNRLTSITNNQQQTTTFTYDTLGRRTSMTHDNGVVTNYDYDAASQLLSLVHQLGATTINSFAYDYDKVGNRETKTDNSGIANYTYDTLNRLVQATNPLPSNPLESFTYDEVGNRTDSNQNGLSSFNDANQLEDDANFTYQYDNNGNLIQKTDQSTFESTVFEYDAENKLIRVASLDKTVNYKYDGLNRRIEKEVTETAVTTVTQYIYEREDILLELDGSNNIVARYTHGPGIDEPLITEKGGASFFYHADALGSITELTDSTGAVAQSYTYSSFGKIESQLDPSFNQPFTFTAREVDAETGLYFYRARTYDPSSGRFLQEDPIGFVGGINFYTYVQNNPINLVDPDGLLVFYFGGGAAGGAGRRIEPTAGDGPNFFSGSAVRFLGTSRGGGEQEGVLFTFGPGRIVGAALGGGLVGGINFGDVEDLDCPGAEVGILVGGISVALTFGENESGNFLTGFSIGFGNRGFGVGAFGTETRTFRVPIARP